MARYDLTSTTLGQLLDDPDVSAIFEKHVPGITSNPMIAMAKGMSAAQAVAMAGPMVGAEKVAAIQAEIEALA